MSPGAVVGVFHGGSGTASSSVRPRGSLRLEQPLEFDAVEPDKSDVLVFLVQNRQLDAKRALVHASPAIANWLSPITRAWRWAGER